MQNLAESRRQTAEKEIGFTLVKRNVSLVSTVFFCVTILFVPVIQHTSEIWERKLPQVYDAFRLLPVPSEEEIEKYEDELEEESVVCNWLLPRVQSILTRYFHLGNEQAYVGRDGWLFYRSDLDSLIGYGFLDKGHQQAKKLNGKPWDSSLQLDPIKAIVDFDRQLKTHNIKLIVMPTPLKPTIHPEKFSARYVNPNAPIRNPSDLAFIEALVSEGILVFDPSKILFNAARQSDQYLKTDTHWTPKAMEYVATHLAKLIVERIELSTSTSRSYTQTAVAIANLGDIAEMLKLPGDQTMFPPERVTTHIVQTLYGERWKPKRDAEILFLGDSFSNIYSLEGMGWGESGGFVEQLSFALEQPIDKIVINAGGAYATRQALAQELKRGDNRLAGKRVVVYQFAARELFSGDWKLLDLLIPSFPELAGQRVQGQHVTITAIIRNKTEPPAPGSVPYPECLIALHLQNIQTHNGVSLPEEVVVFVWGMRKNRWTAAATFKVGQEIKLRLHPWTEVEAEYGSYNRRELESEEAWLLDVYWGEVANQSD